MRILIGFAVLATVASCGLFDVTARAQDASAAPTPRAPSPPADEEDEPLVSDSGVGYIDPAFLANRIRFRYDAAFNNVQPARAEFFWAVDGPFGDGPGPETSVDYQDFSLYAESLVSERIAVFGELPFRQIDPQIQDQTGGLADSNVGVKYALSNWLDWATTLQLRVYIPSGDETRGLGNGHASLEPGLLIYRELAPRVVFEGELKDWISVGGNEGFAGNVLRYGAGLSYNLRDIDELPLRAVVEFVGWTVLDGKSAVSVSADETFIRDAAGDTIVNVKAGFRWWLTESLDVYAGYGRVLTTQTWYDDVLRIELRRTF